MTPTRPTPTRPQTPRRAAGAAFAAAILLAGAAPAAAAELVMFTRAGCPYCLQFDREIAPIYPKTAEGRQAPLRRVDIHERMPADLGFLTPERFTPVFVLVDGGREIGRIRGYPGDMHFWGLVGTLVARLDVTDASAARTAESGALPGREQTTD